MAGRVRFSVVIPLYNKRPYVARAIQSVLDQTYRDFELIVVDDGSTDGSTDIAASYTDARLKLIRQANGGEAAARNAGIRTASGAHIAFLDADDCWKSEFLAVVASMIAIQPDAAIYGTAYDVSRDDDFGAHPLDGVSRFVNASGRLDYPAALAHWCFPLTSSSVCVPACKFDEVGLFDERLNLAADVDMWGRLALSGMAIFHARSCAVYHVDALNRSTTIQAKFWDKRLLFVEVFSKRLQRPEIARRDRRNLELFLSKVTYEALVAKANADPALDLAAAMQDRKQFLKRRHFFQAKARRLMQALHL